MIEFIRNKETGILEAYDNGNKVGDVITMGDTIKNEEKICCPFCGSEYIAKILYGFPDFSDELIEKIERQEVHLGGCIVSDYDPQYYCNDCGKKFHYYSGSMNLFDYILEEELEELYQKMLEEHKHDN